MADFQAESQTPADPAELYAELERSYTEAQWEDVLLQGSRLLAAVQDDPLKEALRSRCQLLLGHANLYGLQRPALARPYYLALQQGTNEPDLRLQAEEALQYCPEAPRAAAGSSVAATPPRQEVAEASPGKPIREPLPQTSPAGTQTDDAAVARGSSADTLFNPAVISQLGSESGSGSAQGMDPFLAAVAAASAAARTPTPAAAAPMPWLADAGASPTTDPASRQDLLAAEGPAAENDAPSGALAPPRLEVEVVEEPELIEVTQADPSLAEELQVELERIRARRRAEAAGGRSAALENLLGDLQPSPEQRLSLEKPAATAEMSVSPSPAVEPARQRPVDLASEDPELVAGLLEVVLKP